MVRIAIKGVNGIKEVIKDIVLRKEFQFSIYKTDASII